MPSKIINIYMNMQTISDTFSGDADRHVDRIQKRREKLKTETRRKTPKGRRGDSY